MNVLGYILTIFGCIFYMLGPFEAFLADNTVDRWKKMEYWVYCAYASSSR